jgi:[ribosomal protein S5]-alanine N-acetyltransferase
MNTNRILTIETSRLQLRLVQPDIYREVMESMDDESISRFFGFTTSMELIEEKNRFRQGVTMAGRSFAYFHLIEKESRKVIGWCGFHTWYTLHRRAELGYILYHETHRNKGFMKEAMSQILAYGFDVLKLNRIEAMVATTNVPSLALLRGFGFRHEGVLRQHYFKNERMEDSEIYSLLAQEYDIKGKDGG